MGTRRELSPEKVATARDIVHAYDVLASEYEMQLGTNPVATEMRNQLHELFVDTFSPGTCALDFSAGTGLDALFLAEHGVTVTALDPSPGMIRELHRSAARRSLRIESHVLSADQLETLVSEPFDGAISTFGGINTMRNLPDLAKQLHKKLKPNGALILHGLNAFCIWQWARGIRRGRWNARGDKIGFGEELGANHFYDPIVLWRQAFKLYFELENVYAQSIVAAPPLVIKYPRAANALFAADRALGRLFPKSGDFFVMELRRRDG